MVERISYNLECTYIRKRGGKGLFDAFSLALSRESISMFGFAASPPYFFHWECVQYFEWGFVAMYANQTNQSVVNAVEAVIAK